MRKRLAFSFCCAFLFSFARGAACPRACDAQDTTKQTGAFSLPLFLYISGREAWQSSCQLRRNLRAIADATLVRVLIVMFMFCARSLSSRALIVDKPILIIPATKTATALTARNRRDPSPAPKTATALTRQEPSRAVARDLRNLNISILVTFSGDSPQIRIDVLDE